MFVVCGVVLGCLVGVVMMVVGLCYVVRNFVLLEWLWCNVCGFW